MPIRKYKERRNAVAFSSARYRPYSKLSHSLRRLLCSYANCYGDEAVAPSFVRFTELLSSPFHYSVTDVKIHRKSAILGGGTFCSGGNVSAKVFIFR